MYERVRVIVKRKRKDKREKAKETCIAAKYFTTGTEYNKQMKRKTTTLTNTKMYAKARAVRRNARLPDVVKR